MGAIWPMGLLFFKKISTRKCQHEFYFQSSNVTKYDLVVQDQMWPNMTWLCKIEGEEVGDGDRTIWLRVTQAVQSESGIGGAITGIHVAQ